MRIPPRVEWRNVLVGALLSITAVACVIFLLASCSIASANVVDKEQPCEASPP